MNGLELFWIFSGGMAIGLFFVAGLWFTVFRWADTPYAGPLFLASFLGRTLVCVGGFYLIIGHQFENALISLAGFLIARIVMVRLLENRFQPQIKENPNVS